MSQDWAQSWCAKADRAEEHSSLCLCEILAARCVWGGGAEVVVTEAWCTEMTSQSLVKPHPLELGSMEDSL